MVWKNEACYRLPFFQSSQVGLIKLALVSRMKNPFVFPLLQWKNRVLEWNPLTISPVTGENSRGVLKNSEIVEYHTLNLCQSNINRIQAHN